MAFLGRAHIVTFALLLTLLSSALSGAEVRPISSSFSVSKGDSKYNGVTYDFTYMTQATADAAVNIADGEVTGSGLNFLGFSAAPASTVYALNMSMANTQVTNSTITMQGYLPRHSRFFFSNTQGDMQGTTPLFVFTDIVPQYYVIINIVDTNVSWPEAGDGGDMLRIGNSVRMVPQYYSAVYVTRANVYNAANVWNVVGSLGKEAYFVNVLSYSMVAIDYVNCHNCKNAFVYASVDETPPIVGSMKCYVRYSNCTQTGGKPFYAAVSTETFSFGPDYANIAFSGITTDGPFFSFKNGAYGQVKTLTTLSFMHINADSSGIVAGKEFPYYAFQGNPTMPYNYVYMGNITLGGTFLSTSSDYTSAYLAPKYIVNNYSKFVSKGAAWSYAKMTYQREYTVGENTHVYCAMDGLASIGTETLGSTENGGETWTRPKCVCKDDTYYAPYCTPVYDPLLYYAGYTFGLDGCNVDNCTKCWWGLPDKCTECDATFMLYPSTWSCVPNVCGECDADDGNIYTYTEGKCVVNAVANCAAVNINGTCVTCSDSYTLYNGTCSLCNVENCAICSTENVCHQCNTDQSYTIDSDGACVYCGDNCATCTSSGCTACNAGYTLSISGECTDICSLSGCATCATSTTCSVCDSGLTLTSAGLCSCNIANCDTCYGTKCKVCSYGYYYSPTANTCETVASVASSSPTQDGSEMTHLTLTTALLVLTIFFAIV